MKSSAIKPGLKTAAVGETGGVGVSGETSAVTGETSAAIGETTDTTADAEYIFH